MTTEKARHLESCINWDYPEICAMKNEPNRLEQFIDYISEKNNFCHLYEVDKKAEILVFLKTNYRNWQNFNVGKADDIVARSIEDAQKPRALADIAELGKAWWGTGDEHYGAAFQKFFSESASGGMINWGSFAATQTEIELNGFELIKDCPGFNLDGRIAFWDHIMTIADFSWGEVSSWKQSALGPEGHNWYIHGMAGLFSLGLQFPEFNKSEFWKKSSWSFVNEHLRAHYREDGGARETCLGYEAGSINQLWRLYALAIRNGYGIPDYIKDTLARSTRFILNLMSPVGGLPSFGDGGHAPGQLTNLAVLAAVYTGDAEFKGYAEHCRKSLPGYQDSDENIIPEAVFWSAGLEGADIYRSLKSKSINRSSAMMFPTGYVAMINDNTVDADYMGIAAARRGAIVTSHGHNDIFAIEVQADGVRYLGELGCANYGTDPERWYDISTQAHNVLQIDDLEQLPINGEWRWEYATVPYVSRWINEDHYDFFHGVHEGYCRLPDLYTLHARKVFFLKSVPESCPEQMAGYWVVLDWLLPGQFDKKVTHDYKVFYHGCVEGAINENAIVFDGGDGKTLSLITPVNEDVKITSVNSDGLQAYRNAKKVSEKEYPCFCIEKTAAATTIPTVIVPSVAGENSPKVSNLPVTINGVEATAEAASALKIEFDTFTDYLCVSHKDFSSEMTFADYSEWGILTFKRVSKTGDVLFEFNQDICEGRNY